MADNAPLKSQYLTQVEADLDRTAKEKDRVAADVAALQQQLATLDHDHTLLLGVKQALTSASATTGPDTVNPTASVPGARTSKATARTAKPAAKKTADRKTADKATTSENTSAGTPTLRDLVLSHLITQSEPRSAAEVTTALERTHPGRVFQTTVVRNTLEGLVAKTQAARTRQNRSVYYTAPTPAAATADADTMSAAIA